MYVEIPDTLKIPSTSSIINPQSKSITSNTSFEHNEHQIKQSVDISSNKFVASNSLFAHNDEIEDCALPIRKDKINGDMNIKEALHQNIGQQNNKDKVDHIFAIGTQSELIQDIMHLCFRLVYE